MDSDTASTQEPNIRSKGGRDLTTGSIVKHLVLFSIPMLLGSLMHTAYSITDAAWVGNGLGTNAMAAVTVSFPIFFVLIAVAGGLTLASNILVAQTFGAKEWDKLRLVLQTSLTLIFSISVVCVCVGQFAAKPLLRVMQTPPEIFDMAVSYLRLIIWTVPFMFGLHLLSSIMRGVGDAKTPLYFQMVSLVVNVFLDPVMMFGWLGCPRMGLNGTALATIISQIGAVLALAVHLQRKQHVAAPDWKKLMLDKPTAVLLLKIGVPSMLQQALVSAGMLVVVGMVNRFGAQASAAFGIAMRIDQLGFMPPMAISMAVSTLVGQNIGAKRYDRVRDTFWWGVAVSVGITLTGSVLAFVLPSQLMGLFAQDPEVVRIGAHYLRVIALGYLLLAVMLVSHGVVNGAGHTLATTFFTLFGFWIVRIPLAAYLSNRLSDVKGIWYATLISFAAGTLVSLAYYMSGRWKRPMRVRQAFLSVSQPAETE